MIFVGDPRPRAARLRADLLQCFDQFLADGRFVLGPGVASFEQAFSDYTGIRNCIGVANGTDAIELALSALGIGAGDRVATAANAGGYASTSLTAVGAVPLYIDVDPDTCCLSIGAVEHCLASRPRALIVTHLYGRIAPEISAIAELCRRHNVFLIEDCAQAHGSRIAGHHAGSFGDASSFSFYPTKNLGGLGDGGAVCTNDDAIAERCRQLRQYGWLSKYEVQHLMGRNSRLDELQARFLELFLADLDEENQKRIVLALRYHERISHPGLVLPAAPSGSSSHVYHLFVVQVRHNREHLQQHLKNQGVLSDIHYPIPDHLQGVHWATEEVRLPVTEDLAASVLSLPCYPDLESADQDQVIEAVNSWSQ